MNELTCTLNSKVGRVAIWLEIEFCSGIEPSETPEKDSSLVEGKALLF